MKERTAGFDEQLARASKKVLTSSKSGALKEVGVGDFDSRGVLGVELLDEHGTGEREGVSEIEGLLLSSDSYIAALQFFPQKTISLTGA